MVATLGDSTTLHKGNLMKGLRAISRDLRTGTQPSLMRGLLLISHGRKYSHAIPPQLL